MTEQKAVVRFGARRLGSLDSEPPKALLEAGFFLGKKKLVVGEEGNLSARSGEGFFVTCTGCSLSALEETDFCRVASFDFDKNEAEFFGDKKPSSETPLHAALYSARSDVNSVVHLHPWAATGFARENKKLVLDGGVVPLVSYSLQGSLELAEKVSGVFSGKKVHVALLEKHGAVAVGRSVKEALGRMLSLEKSALLALLREGVEGEEEERLLGLIGLVSF